MTAESMVSTGSALRHRSALSDSPTCARGPRSNNAADPAIRDFPSSDRITMVAQRIRQLVDRSGRLGGDGRCIIDDDRERGGT